MKMKMKMKLSMVAGALALAVAGQANAVIINNAGLGNTLILSVWDATANTSYTANLGSTIQSFLSNAGVTFGGTSRFAAITGADTASNNFSFVDAGLTAYLATDVAANFQWSVVAGTNAGGALGYGTQGILTTTNAPAATVAAMTAARLSGAVGFEGNYVPAVNTLMGTGNSITTTAAAGAAAYAGDVGFGNDFNGNATFLNTAGLGQSMSFFFVTPTTNARGQYAGSANYQFANAAGASSWTLGANGLNYAAVSAVPEPSDWLLMLSGVGLIGFIASRRKDQDGSMTFA